MGTSVTNHYLTCETRQLNKRGAPYGFKRTTQRTLEPWERWLLETMARCGLETQKHAMLHLIGELVDETCGTLEKAGLDGPRILDIRLKMAQELKDQLESLLSGKGDL